MQKHQAHLMAALAMGLLAAPAVGGDVQVLRRGDWPSEPLLERRPRGYRQGRRWHYGHYLPVNSNGDNPAGSKLAKKAAKGTLTLNGIR